MGVTWKAGRAALYQIGVTGKGRHRENNVQAQRLSYPRPLRAKQGWPMGSARARETEASGFKDAEVLVVS